MSFNQFDTLGNTRTLTGVTISFYFDTTGGSFAVDNDSEEVGFVSFSREIMGKLTSSSVEVGTAGTYFSAQSGFTSAIGADDGDPQDQFDVGGPDYVQYIPENITGTGNAAAISSGFWGGYTGSGSFNVSFLSSQSFSVSGIGGLQSLSIASKISPTVAVTYTYSVTVPEPTTALLGGIGLLSLMRRRRQ